MSTIHVRDVSERRAALSIGVIDDRFVVREGLRALFERSTVTRLEWVSSTLNEALIEAPKRPVDALFVSVDLGGHSFQAAASSLRRAFRRAKLIGVVIDSSGWASRVGDRSMIDDQLLVGGVHPAWFKTLKLDIDGPTGSATNAAPDARSSRTLTNREHEVLSLLIRARDNRSIAHSLGIAEATVKRHVSSILTKFGSKSRAEASLVARQLGYAWE